MFEFDAGKLVIIGIVALIVIGPKELPRVLRQVGQAMAKLRRMATDFQTQFMDAMREAELSEIKEEAQKLAARAKAEVGFDSVAELEQELTRAVDGAGRATAPAAQADRPAAQADRPAAQADGPTAEADGKAPLLPSSQGHSILAPIDLTAHDAGADPARDPASSTPSQDARQDESESAEPVSAEPVSAVSVSGAAAPLRRSEAHDFAGEGVQAGADAAPLGRTPSVSRT